VVIFVKLPKAKGRNKIIQIKQHKNYTDKHLYSLLL